jgi:hypothetical protein
MTAILDPDTRASLSKARAFLVILLATSEKTLLALQAAGNVLDTDLVDDLARMIERSKAELREIDGKLATFSE